MASVSLATYVVRTIDPRIGGPCALGEFDSANGLHSFVSKTFDELRSIPFLEATDQRLLRVSQLNVDPEAHTVEGVIETGEWGYTSEIWDTEQDRIAYERQVTDAELLPFFFLFYLPPNRDEGIAILQRFGAFGVLAAVRSVLQDALISGDHRIKVLLNSLAPKKLFDRWIEDGRIRRIRLVRREIPHDIADMVQLDDHQEGHSEIVLVAKRGGCFPLTPWLSKFLGSRGGPSSEMVELERDTEFDSVKIDVKIGSRQRSFDISSPENIRAYNDVTESVLFKEESGHPTVASLHELAHELLDDLKGEFYGS